MCQLQLGHYKQLRRD